MENLNKKLAYGLWAVSGISTLISLILYVRAGIYVVGIIALVIAFGLQAMLGYTILRDRNDKFTMISVLLISAFGSNIGGIVAIVLRLILRKKRDSEAIRKCWMVPGLVVGCLGLITLFMSFSFISFISLGLNVTYYLIFGYWFIKYLKLN